MYNSLFMHFEAFCFKKAEYFQNKQALFVIKVSVNLLKWSKDEW